MPIKSPLSVYPVPKPVLNSCCTPPSEGPQLGIQPIGSMCSEAVRVGAGELALLMSDPKGSLVGTANGLAGHPKSMWVGHPQ